MNTINLRATSAINRRTTSKIARDLGLVRGKGTYNGAPFWTRPNSNAIITLDRLEELAGLA